MNSDSDHETVDTRTQGVWMSRALIFLTLAACAVPLSGNNADADLWGHVQFGRDVLQYGLPASTTYSYTAVGYPWINHENLAELSFAVVANFAGAAGLLILKCLLGVIVAAAMLYRQRRQGVSLFVACGVTLLVCLNLNFFWQVRPQLFSYFYYALMLLLLSDCFHGWEGAWRLGGAAETDNDDSNKERLGSSINYHSANMRRLWLAPILFVIWTNTHGAFAAGLAIFITYLALRGLEAWSSWRTDSWGVVRRLTMMGAAASLATFLNPYGPRLHSWLLRSLGEARPEITEWHPPPLLSPDWWPLLAIVALFMAAIAMTRRSRDFTHLLILSATIWQTMEHQRHAPFFVLAFGFWMAPHVESMLRQCGVLSKDSLQESDSPLVAKCFGGAIAVTALVLLCLVGNRLRMMKVDRNEYPVSAVKFIHERGLQGRAIVTYNWAQYVIGSLGERNIDGRSNRGLRLAFDGRFRTCYPQELVDMHFDLVLGDMPHLRNRSPQSPPLEGAAVLEYGNPELALISRRQPHSEFVMTQRDDWTLLYQDQLAQVWGRSSVFDDPQNSRFLAPNLRQISNQEQRGAVAWPALPGQGRRNELRRDMSQLDMPKLDRAQLGDALGADTPQGELVEQRQVVRS